MDILDANNFTLSAESIAMPTISRPLACLESRIALSIGISSTQGAHHVAQKFRRTGLPRSWLSVTVFCPSLTVKSGALVPIFAGWELRQEISVIALRNAVTLGLTLEQVDAMTITRDEQGYMFTTPEEKQ